MALNLTSKVCVACEGGIPPFTPEQIEQYKKELKTPWKIEHDVNLLQEFVFKDFKEVMMFVNKVAVLAEQEGHHPDIYIFYNKVRLSLSTHAIHGLSENDFILAAKIEMLL